MAYTVLARRYRSATFDEVVGQNHIAQTLKKAIASNRIAHAYLFCGTRGTGKTSTARIFAKALNCEAGEGPVTEPCSKCTSCQAIARGEDMDVIEIDAASNTGVDNVRDLIENSRFRPARSRFKIYIIDEVHMLSKAAFNALLKTLEEPPEHVKFILATTEAEKVLPTIQSRCQRYDFRNIPTREIAGHLKGICASEGIDATDDALLLVAKAGAGSMRDSLSLLDRLLSIGEKTLTVEHIEQLLGMPRTMQIVELADAIGTGDVHQVLMRTDAMVTSGLSPETLIASLTDHLRNLLILRTCGPKSGLVEVPGISIEELHKQAQQFHAVVLTQDITVLEELRRLVRTSQAGRALLDATLVRLALADQFAQVAELLARVDGDGAAAGAPVVKKKSVGEEPRHQGTEAPRHEEPPAPSKVPPPVAPPAPAPTPVPAVAAVERGHSAAGQDSAPRPTIEPRPAPEPQRAGAIPPPVSLDIDLGEDDDLPRPGKVWDDTGPSLSELVKQSSATGPAPAASTPPPPKPESNVEPVGNDDVKRIWPLLVNGLKEKGVGMGMALSMARLERITSDDTAVIRFGSNAATFAKAWQANGKRDTIRDLLTSIRGKPTAVQFEIDDEAIHNDLPAGASSAPAATPPRAAPPPPTSAPAAAPPPAARGPARPQPEPAQVQPDTRTVVPLSPELVQQLRGDPLVAAVIDELGGQVVRVVET